MHSSAILTSPQFAFAANDSSGDREQPFEQFFPDYHPLDRVGVIAPLADRGITGTAYGVMALTTAFYDVLRAKGGAFFNYPQHFCILDSTANGTNSSYGLIADDFRIPWCGLDVWPESKIHSAGNTPKAMLYAAFSLQLTRIFWPADFVAADDGEPLPGYARELLRFNVKQVLYYNSEHVNRVVMATDTVEEMVRVESIDKLPGADTSHIADIHAQRKAGCGTGEHPWREGYQEITIDAFLERYADLFAAT